MKKRFVVLSPTILCLLVIVVSLFSSVYLAVPKTSALSTVDLTALAASNAACGPLKVLQPQFDACVTGYIGARQGKTEAEACPAGSAEVNSCKAGFGFGTTANKAPGAAPATAADGALTTAEAKTLAASDAACGPLKILKAQFDACVAGYVAARQGKTEAQACPAGSAEVNSCKAGFKFGTDAAATAAVPTGGTTDPNSQELSCDAGFNPLNWLICAAIKGMVAVLNGVDGVINNLLSVGTPDETKSGDPTDIFDTSNATGQAYHTAWASFRNIALGLLLIAGLIMVMTQALGWELLDAYTIRKVLPRLLFAAVAISVSWPGLHFVVQLFNDLGYGVRNLIQAPFASGALQANTIKIGGGQGVATALATAVALQALGVFGLLTFVATALLAAFIAFIVLIVRQIVVVVLIMIAPIALVMYILPNTNKYWKIWMDSLGGALMMFPIISALIAAGRVFSAVANQGGGPGGDTLGSFIAFAAYFAPYFLIPATFKFAGGAVRTIGGAVSDRGKGLSGRIQKARQDSTGRRIKAARSGGIYRDDFLNFKNPFTGKQTSVSRIANKAQAWTFDLDEQALVSLGQSRIPGGKALFGRTSDIKKAQIEDARLAHSRKALQDIGGLHYQAGRALGGQLQYFAGTQNPDGSWSGGDEDMTDETRNKLIRDFGNKDEHGNFNGTWREPTGKQDIEKLGAILAEGGASSTMAAQELLAKAPMLGALKGAGHEETQRADLATMGLMAAAQAGRLETSEIAASANVSTGDIDQPGFAAKRAALLQQIAAPKRTEQREGHGIQYRQVKQRNAAGQLVPVQDRITGQPMLEAYSVYENPFDAKAQASIMSMTSNDIAASKSETLDAIAQTMIAGASEYETVMGPDGRVQRTNNMKQGDALERARAMQSRISYLAAYSQGDSDAGRKLNHVMNVVGMTPSAAATAPAPGTPGGPAGPGAAPSPPPAGGAPPTPPAPGTPPASSDRRLKRNVKHLATNSNGIALYSFQYLWSNQVYVGVMAQDLLDTHPDAVIVGDDGFYLVDYSVLGLKMQTLEEWQVSVTPSTAIF